ncbi:MAG TPA: NADH-quinone oxidoreductase subunit J, partial [Terracidiphilus sp.]|nr:NADH-quinone oxidoreductase subunit J [Terracidiphilus sp.]
MSLVFWLVSALTLAGGLAAVMMKNLVHCALAVSVAFAGLALLFLQLDAQFAGFAQILVYIGAVAILVVFAILLTRNAEVPKEGTVFSKTWLAGLAIAAAVFAVLGWAVLAGVKGVPSSEAAAAPV